MGLLDEAVSASTRPVRKTRLDEIREMMDPDEREELDAALAHPKVTNKALASILTARGYPIGETTVRENRQRP